MDSSLDYLAARLQEPSTYVSLGSLLTAIGFKVAPQYWDSIAMICMGGGGLLGAILRERKKTTSAEIKQAVKETVVPSVVKPGA